MNLSKLGEVLKDEPKYRYKQIYKAVFSDLIEDWQEATNLPAGLRERLAVECPLEIEAQASQAADGAEKALLALNDGQRIETVLIRHDDGPPAKQSQVLQAGLPAKQSQVLQAGLPAAAGAEAGRAGRRTVCVSSQVGCPMGCLFCATGKIGFKRNLTREEIIEQAVWWARLLRQPARVATQSVAGGHELGGQARLLRQRELGGQVTNVVFMGMGEPFLNYDNVLAAIRFLNDENTMNLGARRFSVSTAGVTHGIRKFSEENLEVNLALSLHAADERLRSHIMPINDKYPLPKVMKEIRHYIEKTRRRVMFEYLMIDGLNDSPRQAEALARLVKGYLGFVNLISYNTTEGGLFRPSPPERVRRFKQVLERARIPVVERHRFGESLDAACGQLAARPQRFA